MSNARKKQRKQEIAELREEGYNAARAGKHKQTCIEGNCLLDRIHWLTGYQSYMREHASDDDQP